MEHLGEPWGDPGIEVLYHLVYHVLCGMLMIAPLDHVADVISHVGGTVDGAHVQHKAEKVGCTLWHLEAIGGEVFDDVLNIVIGVKPEMSSPWGSRFGWGYDLYESPFVLEVDSMVIHKFHCDLFFRFLFEWLGSDSVDVRVLLVFAEVHWGDVDCPVRDA